MRSFHTVGAASDRPRAGPCAGSDVMLRPGGPADRRASARSLAEVYYPQRRRLRAVPDCRAWAPMQYWLGMGGWCFVYALVGRAEADNITG
jgi:hypothetical protein